MMDSNMLNSSIPILDHSHMVLDAAMSHMLSGSFMQSGTPDHINCRQTLTGGQFLSTQQEETLINPYVVNDGNMINGDPFSISRITPHVGNISLNGVNGNAGFPNQFMGTSTPVFANPMSATTSSLNESLISFGIASTSALPSEELKTSHSEDRCTDLNSSISALFNCQFGLQASKEDANLNSGWINEEVPGFQTPSIRTTSTVRPSYHIVGTSEDGWIATKSTSNFNHPYSCFAPSNELTLSVGSSQSPGVNLPNVPDQCSEVSCSGLSQDATGFKDYSHGIGHSLSILRSEIGVEFGEKSTTGREHMLYGDSSPIIESRYLRATKEMLAEIASYALEGLDDIDDPLDGSEGDANMSLSLYKSQDHMDSRLQQTENDTRKSELFTMLQAVDRQCKQYLDQIQNVISEFQDRLYLGSAQINVQFALHTVSAFYRSLRRRFISEILLAGQQCDSESTEEKERRLETPFIQRQWALQQMKRNDQQSWRPQRGLPEKSVAVLRAWMFQNFLHPYPKDSEKQMLAIKSGLTRSQVSNWFINARVRLWKPMIEEMYTEINKRNRTDEGSSGESRNHGNISNQRIRMT